MISSIQTALTVHPAHRGSANTTSRPLTHIQDIFVGLAFILHPPSDETTNQKLEFTFVLHDGTGVIGSETYHVDVCVRDELDEGKEEARRVVLEVLSKIGSIQREKAMNIRMIAVALPFPDFGAGDAGTDFLSRVWLDLDAIPFITSSATNMFTQLPSLPTQASATSAITEGIKHLHPATTCATTVEVSPRDHEVMVDCSGQIRLCDLEQYRERTSPELWRRFIALSSLLRQTRTSISFFSATPQGGGVALMRHALIRLWRLVGLDVKWYVPEGHPAVFDITKRKIHNVLQGVAEDGVELSETDKKLFEAWTEQNYETLWNDGALDASVIVIDDPQLAAMISIIRKNRPNAKIIFRSHIQIQSDLTDDPGTTQHRVWNYLFGFIKDVDLFLAHPVKFFVPRNVHENLPVLYMAPSTDPLDGLNKPYDQVSMHYHRQQFNALSAKQCGVEIDWERGYICQIARFDPSKGIPDLLAAYLEFRRNLLALDKPVQDGPQLIIMGHGSVDDPDGTLIYDKTINILSTDEYALVQKDVALVRAPPSDSLLGCILQGAWVATQLSTREGFEVKVTEAINKRVPIIVSDAGGIPLQVKDSINGYIVPVSQPSKVAAILSNLYAQKTDITGSLGSVARTYLNRPETQEAEGAEGAENRSGIDPKALSQENHENSSEKPTNVVIGLGNTSEDFWTVGNSVKWILLATKLVNLEPGQDLGDRVVLEGMGIGDMFTAEGEDGGNVWRMVMGDDIMQGEGEII